MCQITLFAEIFEKHLQNKHSTSMLGKSEDSAMLLLQKTIVRTQIDSSLLPIIKAE